MNFIYFIVGVICLRVKKKNYIKLICVGIIVDRCRDLDYVVFLVIL